MRPFAPCAGLFPDEKTNSASTRAHACASSSARAGSPAVCVRRARQLTAFPRRVRGFRRVRVRLYFPMSVYNPTAFRERVSYAATCFLRGTHSRARDTCFEMYDGDAVVTALVRRARNNDSLRNAIAKGWGDLKEGLPVSWVTTAEKYAAIPDRELDILAARLREESKT